jgi:hypothetical protein
MIFKKRNVLIFGLIVIGIVLLIVIVYRNAQMDGLDYDRYFPAEIGLYKLYRDDINKLELQNVCYKAENNPILQKLKKNGDVCVGTVTREYRTSYSSTTNHVVRVNLSTLTKNKDLFLIVLKETSTKDELFDFSTFHTSPFTIGWLPLNKFDLVVTQEGLFVYSATSTSHIFKGEAKGDNEVTKYFMNKYPSNKI